MKRTLILSLLVLISVGTVLSEDVSVCHCWTAQCNFCRDSECAVKYDLKQGEIAFNTKLSWNSFNTIVLFNSAGEELGTLKFKLGRLLLTGCLQMQTRPLPPKAAWKGLDTTEWSLSMKDDRVTVRIMEWQKSELLVGECREHYNDVMYFAFQTPRTCQKDGDRFTRSTGMEVGPKYNDSCEALCD